MADKLWKAAERRLAALLGGRRIPVTGVDRHGADVESAMFAVQVKRRRSFPAWLDVWLSGICASAKQRKKIGLLVLMTPGKHDKNAMVVMRLSDFRDLHGAVETGDDDDGPTDVSEVARR